MATECETRVDEGSSESTPNRDEKDERDKVRGAHGEGDNICARE
jgi:hypothetical protein